jgi:DNA-binding SARP family transcriptional activator
MPATRADGRDEGDQLASTSTPSAAIRLSLLGRWSLTGVDAPPLAPSGQRLLTYLALRGRCHRQELAGTIWPDVAEKQAHGSLRTTLWRVRSSDSGLVVGADELELGRHVTVDVHELVAQVQVPPTRLTAVPRRLLDGDLVPGWSDDWLLIERERIRQLRLYALEALARAFAADGRYTLGLTAGLAAVRANPLRESAQRAVIDLYLRAGEHGRARHHLEAYRLLLRQNLGVTPSARTLGLLPSEPPAVTGPRR